MRPPDRRPLRMPHHIVRHDTVVAPPAGGRGVVVHRLRAAPPLDAAPRIRRVEEDAGVHDEIIHVVQFDHGRGDRLVRHMQLLPIVRTARVHNIPMVVHVTGLPVVAGPQDAVRESVHAVDDDVMAQCALGAQQVAQVLQVLITAEPDVTDRDITTIGNPETRPNLKILQFKLLR